MAGNKSWNLRCGAAKSQLTSDPKSETMGYPTNLDHGRRQTPDRECNHQYILYQWTDPEHHSIENPSYPKVMHCIVLVSEEKLLLLSRDYVLWFP